jgi:hypothetical protein
LADFQTIATRRNPIIEKKLPIWKQIELNYYGGTDYNNGDYLFQYPKESNESYAVRKKRAVLFNQLAPIVDLLVGFIFANQPQRTNTEKVEYFIENASKGASINNFMRSVAKWSLMFTCGVLVDSPEFSTDIIQTEQDREAAELNPFGVLYKPERIRDFSVDSIGQLRWVLLDNSYIDNSDPTAEPKEVTIYRLWTVDTWQDYIINDGENSQTEMGDGGTHPIGYVPFKFVNWRDDNVDFIAESICEDLALINQSIYNSTSYMDEMLASGTFKMLFYPSPDGEVPAALKQGISPLGIIPFPEQSSEKPFFEGAKLEEIDPFINALRLYMTELLKKVGLDQDEAKEFVKSGKARKFDFEKVKTLLTSGAGELQALEMWMFGTAQRWQGQDSDTTVNYVKDFLSEDVDERLARYAELALLPYAEAKKKIHELMLKTALSNDLEVEELEAMVKEIDEAEIIEPDIDAMIDEETEEDEDE